MLILLSFPTSTLIYRGIFQITMNTTLNQLVIFIVLGIAADDIFVFCDAWRQSANIPFLADDLHRRMAYSFKRSFSAILVTSSTTAFAFLSNAMSDIRPIRAFGIFAAIIIPVNFCLVIMIMPPAQILFDKYLKERCSCKRLIARCRCKNVDDEKPAPPVKAKEGKDKTKASNAVANEKDQKNSKTA